MVGEYPLYMDGENKGRLTVRREGIRTVFEAECGDRGDGIYRAFAEGDGGVLPLGVMCPRNGRLYAKRTLSRNDIEKAGVTGISQGQAIISYRFPEKAEEDDKPVFGWRPIEQPEKLFEDKLLSASAEGTKGAIIRTYGRGFMLAIPFEPGGVFNMTPIFCFGRVEKIGERDFIVFKIDGGAPKFQ